MTIVYALAGGFAALMALYTAAMIFGIAPKHPLRPAAGVAGFIVVLAFAGMLMVESLGRPKPFSWEDHEAGTVISTNFEEGVAIYVWVRWPDEPHPKAYRLPWDLQKAQEALQAAMVSRAAGTRMRVEHDREHYGGFRFHAEVPTQPQQKMQ